MTEISYQVSKEKIEFLLECLFKRVEHFQNLIKGRLEEDKERLSYGEEGIFSFEEKQTLLYWLKELTYIKKQIVDCKVKERYRPFLEERLQILITFYDFVEGNMSDFLQQGKQYRGFSCFEVENFY